MTRAAQRRVDERHDQQRGETLALGVEHHEPAPRPLSRPDRDADGEGDEHDEREAPEQRADRDVPAPGERAREQRPDERGRDERAGEGAQRDRRPAAGERHEPDGRHLGARQADGEQPVSHRRRERTSQRPGSELEHDDRRERQHRHGAPASAQPQQVLERDAERGGEHEQRQQRIRAPGHPARGGEQRERSRRKRELWQHDRHAGKHGAPHRRSATASWGSPTVRRASAERLIALPDACRRARGSARPPPRSRGRARVSDRRGAKPAPGCRGSRRAFRRVPRPGRRSR